MICIMPRRLQPLWSFNAVLKVLGGPVAATVRSFEYLGADLVLRCAVGSEQIVVRAEGRTESALGAPIALGWRAEDEHFFDAQGQRVV